MEVPSLFHLYCCFYSICFYYGDGLEMERSGNCLILDAHWLDPYSRCTRIGLYLMQFYCQGGVWMERDGNCHVQGEIGSSYHPYSNS